MRIGHKKRLSARRLRRIVVDTAWCCAKQAVIAALFLSLMVPCSAQSRLAAMLIPAGLLESTSEPVETESPGEEEGNSDATEWGTVASRSRSSRESIGLAFLNQGRLLLTTGSSPRGDYSSAKDSGSCFSGAPLSLRC